MRPGTRGQVNLSIVFISSDFPMRSLHFLMKRLLFINKSKTKIISPLPLGQHKPILTTGCCGLQVIFPHGLQNGYFMSTLLELPCHSLSLCLSIVTINKVPKVQSQKSSDRPLNFYFMIFYFPTKRILTYIQRVR